MRRQDRSCASSPSAGWDRSSAGSFHSRAIRASLAVATQRPSGLNAAGYPPPILQWGRHRLAQHGVPHLRPLSPRARDQIAPVRAERYAPHDVGVVQGRSERFSGGDIPDARGLIIAGGGDPAAIRAEHCLPHDAPVPHRRCERASGGRIPEVRGLNWRRRSAAGAHPR